MRDGMRKVIAAMMLLTMNGLAGAEGHGRALWLAESAQVQSGQTLRTAVRLTLDPGWHVYWVNPGDAGMPTSVVWELPPGWSAGELWHPWPLRFQSGELHGLGHEGEVRYPVTLTAPEGFEGQVTLKGKLKWLACNDDACVPGSADLTLELRAGESLMSAQAGEVQLAHARMPKPFPQLGLQVHDEGDAWSFRLLGEGAAQLARGHFRVATPDLVDSKLEIRFEADGERQAHARVAKSPYAPKSPDRVELWVLPEGGIAPHILSWSAADRK